MYRIAWCIKEIFGKPQYSFGGWQQEQKLTELKEWCYKQNSIDSNTYYWIEKKEGDKIKNVSCEWYKEYETDFVNIEKVNHFHGKQT
jgi:hypothetical protein